MVAEISDDLSADLESFLDRDADSLNGSACVMDDRDQSLKRVAVRKEVGDEESGELTLAFSMLDISEKSLEGEFDSRCPICATKENTIDVIRKNMEAEGISFNTEELEPPHHVPADSDFVKTLLSAYESYSGRKGECIAIGGGTYVHHLKNGVAFGACLPETENHMHGPDEFAVVDELLMSAKIFAQVIVDLCS